MYQVSSSAQVQVLLNQLYVLLAQLQSIQAAQGTGVTVYTPSYGGSTGYSYGGGSYDHNNYDVEVDTDDADMQGSYDADLSGSVDLHNAPYAYVWFEYGQNGRLTDESKTLKVTADRSFEISISDLDKNERYYYRTVAEDPSGYRIYGSIESFETGNSSYSNTDDVPDVTTNNATSITDDSAKMYGEVDMNDFENGTVFLVYGEDEGSVEDVEDENRYSDIDEDGNDLQKVRVYSGLDGYRSFWYTVSGGFDDNTDYYFRYCVEYEDDNGDNTIECGSVENFETD